MNSTALFFLTFFTAILLFGCDPPTPAHLPDRKQIAELKEDAKKGDAEAQYKLSQVYRYGVGRQLGTPQDSSKADKLENEAAKQGHALARQRKKEREEMYDRYDRESEKETKERGW